MTFALFRKKAAAQPESASAPAQALPKGLLPPESAARLLATPRRQQLLDHIWQRTSLSRAQFASLYRAPIERYALLVQQFPASETHHHAHLGGMLDHGLEIVAYALRLRQSHLLPVGSPPESQAAQAEAWTAGAAYAALLHDVGKIAVDLHVEHQDGRRWYPWHGPLQKPYRFRFRRDRAYRLHGAAAGLVYTNILDPLIMDWLSGFPELWAALLYVLAGQYEHAGILGELVVQADQASVAQDLGGDPAKARTAPKRTLQRQLIDGLRYLVRELKLNQPHASDGWLTQDALWLISKTTCDRLRAHLLSQGIDGIPENNVTFFNALQDHGIVLAAPNGKAIWRATVISDAGWSNTFTFLRLSPAMIWEANERPPTFKGTIRIEDAADSRRETTPAAHALTSTPAEHASAGSSHVEAIHQEAVKDALALSDLPSACPASDDNAERASAPISMSDGESTRMHSNPSTPPVEAPGERFITWLRDAVASHRLIINDSRALVHTVDGTAFLVSPGVFQRYAQENPELAEAARHDGMAAWEWIQKRFERLRAHKKQRNGLNIWTCEVTGPRKSRRLHGYLLIDGHAIFSQLPPNNLYLKVQTDSKNPNAAAA
ncbi:helicase [Steroidobacter agaridevorans]|uniref:Helicase n=1 Tax=Steroidobacter agaridevorans TaxID=2695856 RepID=A0A829Y7E4_9GAMM|nr:MULTISPECIES: MobH family relaxase [Steroidobacteraceae]GFE79140.1 helicase [Steroidobacter agaridevorans]